MTSSRSLRENTVAVTGLERAPGAERPLPWRGVQIFDAVAPINGSRLEYVDDYPVNGRFYRSGICRDADTEIAIAERPLLLGITVHGWLGPEPNSISNRQRRP
jgi:hypothetical protein